MGIDPATLASRHDSGASDPFATPPAVASDLPTRPEPVALGRPINPQDYLEYEPTKSASMSSAGTFSELDEKSGSMERGAREGRQKRSSRRSSRDPEKAVQTPHRHSRDSRDQRSRQNVNHRTYYEDDEGEERSRQEDGALKILLFLAGPCLVLSFLNAIWTIISLFITLMTQPVRLCARRPTFGQQLGGLVGPALNLQLKSIYTPLPPHADEDTTYKPGMLMLVMLLSPFLSMAMMLAAWVAAIYWVSSAVVGDPAGLDKRDDGRETVLTLRKWWEKWLVRSMREE